MDKRQDKPRITKIKKIINDLFYLKKKKRIVSAIQKKIMRKEKINLLQVN